MGYSPYRLGNSSTNNKTCQIWRIRWQRMLDGCDSRHPTWPSADIRSCSKRQQIREPALPKLAKAVASLWQRGNSGQWRVEKNPGDIAQQKSLPVFFEGILRKPPPPGCVFIPSLRFAPRKTFSHPLARSHRFPCFSLIRGCCTPPHFNIEHKGNEDCEQVASYISSFFSRASRRGKRFNTMVDSSSWLKMTSFPRAEFTPTMWGE